MSGLSSESSPGWLNRIKVWPQYILPQQGLTALAHRISQSRKPWLYKPLIRGFSRIFLVDLQESKHGIEQFECFNQFFTRELKSGSREFPSNPSLLVSPSDGTLSQLGYIEHGRIFQAKGHDFTTAELIGDAGLAKRFDDGHFATIYLAPQDYHRVHMPFNGRLTHEIRIPGRLFSVSDTTSRVIPRLYARNERMVALFDTANGPMAVVMVAAMLVAGIETTWAPDDSPRPGWALKIQPIESTVELERGDELGRFHWGSTVVLLTGRDFADWLHELEPGQTMRLGQAMTAA